MQRNVSLEAALDEARDTYSSARPKSRAVHEKACNFLPGGNTRSVLYHGPFPIRAERGEGAYLIDADGHRYLNLLGEYTAGVFGHNHPTIIAALQEALASGVNLGAHNQAEARLAELVTERFPALERVRFTNSGTEANLMAVSTARHVTGRSKVMVFHGGYHGGLLYFGGGGIPINAPFEFILGTYNDPDGARALIQKHAESLACVLVEPMMGSGGCIAGQPEFLGALRDATSEAGALLIFDEVMTSRFGPGGAGQMLGITPDLMTLGKWVGGGMSFGAYGGREDIMRIYDPTKPGAMPHAGTFNNNVLSMMGGIAALNKVFTPSAAEALHARGDHLRERLNTTFETNNAALSASGVGSLMSIHATTGPVTRISDLADSNDAVKELLFLDLLERGYYMARRGFIALTIVATDSELDGFVATVDDIIKSRSTVIPQRAS